MTTHALFEMKSARALLALGLCAVGCGGTLSQQASTAAPAEEVRGAAAPTAAESSSSPAQLATSAAPKVAVAPLPRGYYIARQLYTAGLVSAGVMGLTAIAFAGIDAWKWSQATPKGGWDGCYDGTAPAAECARARKLQNEASLWQMNTSWVFVGGTGLAMVAYGVGTFFWPAPSAKKMAISVSPVVGPSGGGLGISGSF